MTKKSFTEVIQEQVRKGKFIGATVSLEACGAPKDSTHDESIFPVVMVPLIDDMEFAPGDYKVTLLPHMVSGKVRGMPLMVDMEKDCSGVVVEDIKFQPIARFEGGIDTVPYPEDIPFPPPKIPISFDGVLDATLDRQLAFFMQLYKEKLSCSVQVSDLAEMSKEDKEFLLEDIREVLGISEEFYDPGEMEKG